MKRMALWVAGAIVFGLLMMSCAYAQTTVNVWSGVAPGSEHWTWKKKVFHNVVSGGEHLGTIVEDVVIPTLTIYLPSSAKATGTGVIIAPGGGCVALSMKAPNEAARWLQQRGIAAFVLQYRIPEKTYSGPPPKNLNEDLACRWGIADGIQAVKVVREHATQWGISNNRVGFMGFSAGGMIAAEALAQNNPAERPNFVGLIYGAPFASMPAIPAKLPSNYKLATPSLPPVFMAWAQDDNTAGYAMRRFYKLLRAEGYQPEAHIYYAGHHAFAMRKSKTTAKHWLQEFYWWLQARGFTSPSLHN